MEKIIVAFESEKTALRVKELLEGGGAAACLVCRTADQVRRAINKLPVPAVVCGYAMRPPASTNSRTERYIISRCALFRTNTVYRTPR